MAIQPGIYRHYKGKEYFVVGTVTHSETRETFVLYMPKYPNDEGFVVRPISMFIDEVEIDDAKRPRFEFVREV